MPRMSAKMGWGGGREVGRKEVAGILGSGKRPEQSQGGEATAGGTNARPQGTRGWRGGQAQSTGGAIPVNLKFNL